MHIQAVVKTVVETEDVNMLCLNAVFGPDGPKSLKII